MTSAEKERARKDCMAPDETDILAKTHWAYVLSSKQDVIFMNMEIAKAEKALLWGFKAMELRGLLANLN